MTRIIKSLGFLLIFCQLISGQNLQSASEFLGYETGTKFTYHHRMVDYFEYVSENSPRVKLIQYGKSFENRPLLLAVISSEENINNIEQIRQNNLIRTGLLKGEYAGEQKPIVWLSYNVHGSESVGTESAIATINSLVDTKNEEITKWLEKVIVIIDPCLNPDGRERYVNWYRQVENKNPNVDYDSWEHSQPWPGGRTNHYFFDLNRDWAWQTQIETQYRMKVYHDWMPHIHIDFHEMGANSPYFFAPGAKPYHEVITEWQQPKS